MIDGPKVRNKNVIAERFNQFFTNVGPKLARKIDTSNNTNLNLIIDLDNILMIQAIYKSMLVYFQ